MKIGTRQRQELDLLRQTLDRLDSAVGRDSRDTFRALRDRLDTWAARVAVIGQVKAGKSTFLNAFLHQQDLLPSDVNPWTSVVTNLRINMPGDTPNSARFEFFDEADWDEIVTGGSRIRALTEQLLPGFDTDLLRRQTEEMRARAERRLGRHFGLLLGKHHAYDFVTPDLLQRYVCAGPGLDEGLENEALGRYAALTKVANVSMRLPAFEVPTILTDTPGVNDPFLVRDEFTCRSLDHSDVFIVVLSAHQPLTDVDIALIRILATQDAKDVLIFVNRVDELDDYEHEVPRVMHDVADRLQQAIPDIDFTVVAGSGYMAELTQRSDPEAQAQAAAMDTPQLAQYLRRRHGFVPDSREDRLWLASGLDDVRAALAEVIDDGVGRQQLGQLRADIRAELNGAQFVARRQRESLHNQVDSISGEVALAAAAELEAEIAGIRALRDELEGHVETLDRQLEKVLSKSWATLESRLLGAIDGFVEDQNQVFRNRLLDFARPGLGQPTLEIDLAPLQDAMGREIVACHARSRAGSDVALNNCLHACRHSIHGLFDDPTENIALDGLPHDAFNSTLTLAKRTLKVALIAGRGWAFWRRPEIDVEKSIEALRAIAAEELRPPVEKIMAAFNEAQTERAEAGTGRIRVLLRMIETSLVDRTQRLKKDKADLEQLAHDPALQRRVVQRLQSDMEVLERRLITLSTIDSALSGTALRIAA